MKILSYTFLSLILLSVFSCKTRPKPVSHTVNKGITVSYSANWKEDKSYDEDVFLVLFAKDKNGRPSVWEHIKMYAADQKDKPLDFQSMVNQNKKYSIDNNIPLLEESITTVDNKEAFRVVYRINENGQQMKNLQFMQSFNGKFYLLTFNSREDKFDEYKEEAEAILRSVHY
ncbi:MAG TPA: PsbP-related protein [Ferruginibacter sp.]|nr:PsbP-related protein [Ferruginibacter sp.]